MINCKFCGNGLGGVKIGRKQIPICPHCSSRMISEDLKSMTDGPIVCMACGGKFEKSEKIDLKPDDIFICRRCSKRMVTIKPPKFPPSDPFTLGPCPSSAFVITHPRELDLIRRAMKDGKVVVVTGPLGIGKTAICLHLVQELIVEGLTVDASQQVVPAFVDAAAYKTVDDLIRGLVLELQLDASGDRASIFRLFSQWPQTHKEKLALVIDNIAECGENVNELGEFLRALADVKNISLILSGESKRIKKFLKAASALEDRVEIGIKVRPMRREEIEQMLKLRLKMHNCEDIMDEKAFHAIYKVSGGVPRKALKAASKALEFAREKNIRVDDKVVRRANLGSIFFRLFG